jgi:hypothetical protein
VGQADLEELTFQVAIFMGACNPVLARVRVLGLCRARQPATQNIGVGRDCASRRARGVLVLCAEGFAPARIGLEAWLEGDAPRLEGLRRVHELLGQLAKLHHSKNP